MVTPRKLLVLLCCSAFGVFGTVVPAGASEAYTVQSGDTLSEIALETGSTVSELVRINGLKSADEIKIGQTLIIGEETNADRADSYEVQAGDTLGHISIRLGVSAQALVELNAISNPHQIRAGMSLQVPSQVNSYSSQSLEESTLPADLVAQQGRLSLMDSFERWANANSIAPDLLMAVAWHESGWQQDVVSNKGAVGIGQLMPRTSRWIAEDLIGVSDLDPEVAEDNIRMSARYLGWLVNYFGSEELAVAAYYQGQGAVRSGVMYTDTVKYVSAVSNLRKKFSSS